MSAQDRIAEIISQFRSARAELAALGGPDWKRVEELSRPEAGEAGAANDAGPSQLFFDANPLPMWVYDVDSLRFLRVNQAAVEKYGFSPDEFLSMTIADIRPEEDVPALQENVRRISGGIDRAGVWRHVTKAGEIMLMEITSSLVEWGGRRAEIVVAVDVTEKVQHESTLIDRNVLLEAAQKIGHMGGWSVDLRTRRLEWAPETMVLFGVKPEDFTHNNSFFRSLVLQEYWPTLDQAFNEALAGDGTMQSEYRIRRPDGELRWMFQRGKIERDPEGKPFRMFGMVMDVTDARRAEEEGSRQRALIEMATHLNRLGGWELSVPDYSFQCSETVGLVLGMETGRQVSFDEFVGCFAPEWQASIRQLITECGRSGQQVDCEMELVATDGQRRSVRTVGEAVTNTGGVIVRVQGAIQDVTDFRALERRLAAEEERFRLVARATVDAVWDWDLLTNTLWWNDAIETQFGYDRATLVKDITSWSDQIHAEDKAWVLDDVHRAIHGRAEHWEGRYRFRRADGKYAWVHDRGFVIRDHEGRGVRMVGGMSDISEQVALQNSLQQSQRLESIGHLTGGIAHDFNNLLTVIMGNAELLRETPDQPPMQQTLAEVIEQAARRGAELTHQLLAFARRQALEPKPCDINRMVSEMDSLLRRTLGENIEVEFVRGAGLWKAFVDKPQLESALLNLCINSRDAMPEGGKLTIETANVAIDANYVERNPDAAEGQHVMLAVSDTGVGIPGDVIAHVFEPFFTTKQEGHGTGLGLSMVYGFVKQSNGHVKIYSEPGHGTTVRIYLPRSLEPATDSESGKIAFAIRGGTERVLVVEDDPLVRQFAVDQLRTLGYEVTEVGSGPAAMAIMESGQDFDLLFTDIVMPGGMNGRQLADEAVKLRPGLKVLYTSGYTTNAIVHHGRLDPRAQLLGKPYGRKDLARKVREVLDGLH